MSDLSPLSGEERKSNFGAVRSVDDPKGEVADYSMTSSASIVGGMLRLRALAVASGDKDVAFW